MTKHEKARKKRQVAVDSAFSKTVKACLAKGVKGKNQDLRSRTMEQNRLAIGPLADPLSKKSAALSIQTQETGATT